MFTFNRFELPRTELRSPPPSKKDPNSEKQDLWTYFSKNKLRNISFKLAHQYDLVKTKAVFATYDNLNSIKKLIRRTEFSWPKNMMGRKESMAKLIKNLTQRKPTDNLSEVEKSSDTCYTCLPSVQLSFQNNKFGPSLALSLPLIPLTSGWQKTRPLSSCQLIFLLPV